MPKKLRPTARQKKLGLEAMSASVRYSRESESTETGRRASALRHRAHPLSGNHRHDEAYKLLLEAASLFEPGDASAAASSAWFDLAEWYKRRKDGVRRENLTEARRLLELSVASPARRRDPLRLAAAHDSLGQVLRHLVPETPLIADELKRSALLHFVEACRISEQRAGLGWKQASESYMNLGNALHQFGEWDDAVQAYELAIRFADAVRDLPRGFPELRHLDGFRSGWEQLLELNLGRALLSRGQPADAERAFALLEGVTRRGIAPHDEQARLLAVGHLLEQGGSQERLRRYLRDIDTHRLPDRERILLARFLHTDGQHDRALLVCGEGVADAMKLRQEAVADHVADHAAAVAQGFARVAAEVCLAKGDPVAAFLQLENTSGLRFHDQVSSFFWTPEDPVILALTDEMRREGFLSKTLEDLASRVSSMDESPRELLEMIASEDVPASHPWALGMAESAFEPIRVAARAAIAAASPASELRRHAERHIRENQRLTYILRRECPEADPTRHIWSQGLDPQGLRGVLEEHPGLVLLRIHQATDVLAVAVWLADGEVRGHGAVIAQPEIENRQSLGEDEPWFGHAEYLEQLDLTDVLPNPDLGHHHVVVLPSLLASFVPWAAAGRCGRTLLDRFAAISWMPILTPLLMRQGPRPRRAGTLIVTPGSAEGEAKTQFHQLAYSEPMDGERRLDGPGATLDAVESTAGHADVVSFYAHGDHQGGFGGTIQLVDDVLSAGAIGTLFAGCERVELWACETGINLPTDPLIPPVDDAFGIDAAFLHGGARSTIGTLWKVPDFVTGHIVRRYRRELAEGGTPPQALATAQRWWRDEAIGVVRTELQARPFEEAIEAIARRLGGPRPDLVATLGPVDDDEPLSPHEVDECIAHLEGPASWAGYRFVGVHDRRPEGEWNDEIHRPLTPAERERLDALLADTGPLQMDPDDWWDEQLHALHEACSKRPPSPSESLRAARLYGTRRRSSRHHNLARGLAWVHEALATPGLGADDQLALHSEAAWMWLELARGERTSARFRLPSLESELYVQRVRQHLPHVYELDQIVLEVWCAQLEDAALREDLEATIRAGWPALEQGLSSPCDDAHVHARRRAAAIDWLLQAEQLPPGVKAARLLSWTLADSLADVVAQSMNAELEVLLCELASQQGQTPPLPPAWVLSHRGRVRRLRVLSGRTATGDSIDTLVLAKALNEDVGLIESDFWGVSDDDGTPAWATTGSPGGAWAEFMGHYLGNTSTVGKESAAVHFLGSLHMGADLRLGPMNTTTRIKPGDDRSVQMFPWAACATRQALLEAMIDASAAPGAPTEGGRFTLHSADPYQISSDALLAAAMEDEWAITGWQLATMVRAWETKEFPRRTAAFAAESLATSLDRRAIENWRMSKEAMDSVVDDAPQFSGSDHHFLQEFKDMLIPQRVLRSAEEAARELSSRFVVVGMCLGERGELVMASRWERDGRAEQRLWVGEPEGGLVAAGLLALMVGPLPSDYERGRWANQEGAPSRDDLWRQLCSHVVPGVEAVLSDAAGVQRQWLAVLAPGPLRSLPWVGIPLGDSTVVDHFEAVLALPHLGFDRTLAFQPPSDGSGTWCSVSRDLEGETEFGIAVVETLRALYGVDVVGEPAGPVRSTDIVEVNSMEVAPEVLRTVRFYGARGTKTLNTSTEGLALSGYRALTARNLIGTLLPRTRQVEFWASTGGAGEAARIRRLGQDVMPAMVHIVLSHGAAGVLDLAWPIPDLTKAMICEGFAVFNRRHGLDGPQALAWSLRTTREMLGWWASHGDQYPDVAAAMATLNQLRAESYEQVGIDVRNGARVLPTPELPAGVTVSQWVAEVASPTHFASPRWWGV